MTTAPEFPYRTSFWIEKEPDRAPRMEATVRVDIAVVGGGFAGLSSARCLKEADPSLDVALVEAEYVGFGASGRNAGFVSPMPPVTWIAEDLTESNRRENVRWAVSYIYQQARELETLIEQEGIACDFRPAQLIITAPGRFRWNALKWVASQFEAVGLPCRTMPQAELRDSARYPGRGDIVMKASSLQPYHLARGLLQVIRRRGVRVYEGTRVSRMTPTETGVELLMQNGARLYARNVVLATNAYTPQLRFGPRTLFPHSSHTCMIATEPLDEATRERFGFRGSCLGDVSLDLVYTRMYRDRLLFGGGGTVSSRADTAADQNASYYRGLRAGMVRRFPFLDGVRLDAAWGGPIHETITDAPVVRPAAGSPRVVLNVGYSSSGVALTQFSGRMVAGLVLGKPHIDPDAERLRRMYEASRLPVARLLKLGLRFAWPSALRA